MQVATHLGRSEGIAVPQWLRWLKAESGHPLLVMRAEGDLDGDGARSTFERNASVDAEGNLVRTDILFVRNRVE